MYIENGVEKLSKAQISKLLNGHKVRIKKGQDMKLNMTEEHSKKLNRAHMKGSGTTIQLDPYAIASNQHLRQLADAFRALQGNDVYRALTGGTLLIDEPITARQVVNNTGNFFKNPGKTLGFGARGGTLLIDQPFTARQAVNNTGNFFKDPKGTMGFGLHEPPTRSPDQKGRGRPRKQQMNGQGFWEDVGKVAKSAGKTAIKGLANEVVQYAGPTAGLAFAAAAKASGKPEYAQTAEVLGNEIGSRAGRYVNKRIQGMGVRRRGRPRKGGAALPPGTPYGVY